MTQTAEENAHPPVTAYHPPAGLDAALAAVPLAEVSRKPERIGYLTNYSFHIWYQIGIEILKRRGAAYGIELEIVEAELSVERQREQAREMAGKGGARSLTPANADGLPAMRSRAPRSG